METKPLLINGEWRATASQQVVRAPYTGEVAARVSAASKDEAEESIAAAARAAIEMRGLARYEIAEALRRISDYIKARREDFARTIALEAGKPIQ
ncbi:MAG: aldehyde dehydrogenase family protein, partial [Acidobacteria bacterium]|nr:aldehyde dehydrogenase family protein [Acidobacteriota bacterium]